jgi:hypothetical protein
MCLILLCNSYGKPFEARSPKYKMRLSASSGWSVRLPSVGMEELGYHLTDFHEILHLSIFRKSFEKVQLSSKPDKKAGYFT